MPATGDVLRLLAEVNGRRREDVSLAALARIAHRSPFELHRRFRRVVGEAPKGYVARVRLSRAAAALVGSADPVAGIAAAHGFASHEVFTRAFTRRFGVPPRAYRAAGVRPAATADLHAATVDSVAPCIGLYRITATTTRERGEAMPADVTVEDRPEIHALVMQRRITWDGVAGALGEMLPALFEFAQRHGLAMTGPPFTRYLEAGMGSLLVQGAVPVAEPYAGDLPEGMEALTVPAGPAAVLVHVGPYERLAETYRELELWQEREGRTPAGPPRETYLTDPGENPDPETWRTEIAQPVR